MISTLFDTTSLVARRSLCLSHDKLKDIGHDILFLAHVMVNRSSKLVWLALFVLLSSIGQLRAQSLDPSKPTAIRSATLTGRIAARDLGDARLTDHYYRFSGTPGDLLITIRSQNLNGDLDVFTAVGLRPLLKITLYAESTNPIT